MKKYLTTILCLLSVYSHASNLTIGFGASSGDFWIDGDEKIIKDAKFKAIKNAKQQFGCIPYGYEQCRRFKRISDWKVNTVIGSRYLLAEVAASFVFDSDLGVVEFTESTSQEGKEVYMSPSKVVAKLKKRILENAKFKCGNEELTRLTPFVKKFSGHFDFRKVDVSAEFKCNI